MKAERTKTIRGCGMMTLEEIKGKLPTLAETLDVAYRDCKDYTSEQMDRMFNEGRVDPKVYEAYCYLWRNMNWRYSTKYIGYQL